MTLKKLREFLADLFASKIKHDVHSFECRLPVETIEQHMFTFLNQRYGLKNLIVDTAASIVNSITVYA
jgi:hypothetical protein